MPLVLHLQIVGFQMRRLSYYFIQFLSVMENNNITTILLASLLLAVCLHTKTTDPDNDDCPCHIYHNYLDLLIADCQNKNLTTIPECVPNNTQWLNLVSNHLRYSPRQFQRFDNVLVLILDSNFDFAAQTDSFRSLSRLVYLELGYTDLTNLTGETFSDQSNLKELGLAGNIGQLNVSQELFHHVGNLDGLDLSYKKEFELPNWSFVRLPLLTKLYLQEAEVLTLHNFTFSGLRGLTFLDLSNILATINLPVGVFKPLTSLEELHLEGLCISIKPTYECTNIDEPLQYVPSLKRLYIDKSLAASLGR